MNHPVYDANLRKAKLLAAQLDHWPDSIMLTDDELIAGVEVKCAGYTDPNGGGIDWHHRVNVYRTNHPDAVSYSVVDGTGRVCYGMRYGFEGQDYISF